MASRYIEWRKQRQEEKKNKESVSVTVPKLDGHSNWANFKKVALIKLDAELGVRGIHLSYLNRITNNTKSIPDDIEMGWLLHTQGWNHIQRFETRQHGFGAWRALKSHYEGDAYRAILWDKAFSTLTTLTYTG
eukprot:11363172-Ditylum_brightwellii.AAC.1